MIRDIDTSLDALVKANPQLTRKGASMAEKTEEKSTFVQTSVVIDAITIAKIDTLAKDYAKGMFVRVSRNATIRLLISEALKARGIK